MRKWLEAAYLWLLKMRFLKPQDVSRLIFEAELKGFHRGVAITLQSFQEEKQRLKKLCHQCQAMDYKFEHGKPYFTDVERHA